MNRRAVRQLATAAIIYGWLYIQINQGWKQFAVTAALFIIYPLLLIANKEQN